MRVAGQHFRFDGFQLASEAVHKGHPLTVRGLQKFAFFA